MDIELKPCPFCGGTGEKMFVVDKNNDPVRYWIKCDTCGASPYVVFYDKHSNFNDDHYWNLLLKRWNRRDS